MYANLARLGDVYFALLGVYSDQLKANLGKPRDAKPRVLASSATPSATPLRTEDRRAADKVVSSLRDKHMSRTMPHNAWLFSIILVSLASPGAAYPSIEPIQDDTALVYIFREDNMRLSGKRAVYMDETTIALLPRLSYSTAITEPGWHLMWGDVRSEWFEFQGGRTYLLRIMARQTGDDQWLLDDAGRIQQGISVFNLQHVVLTEKSLAKLRKKLHKYARARKRAGDRPESVYSAELKGIQYKDKPPGLFAGIGKRGTLRLTETAISFQANNRELEIPMGDILEVGLHGNFSDWIAIRYREQGSIQTAYFGTISSFGAYNRMLLAIQQSISTRLEQAEPATGPWALEGAEELVSAIEAAERGEEPPTDPPQDVDGALSEAAEGLNRYLDEHPDDVSALILSARLQRLQDLSEPVVWSPSAGEQPPKRSLDAAHERLNRALALDSDKAEAHYWHARLYGIREPVVVDGVLWDRPRNLDKAIEHAQHAVELAPAKSAYREALGLYLYDADRYNDAVTVTRELADGRHLMHRLLTDMEALELPDSATYSLTETRKFISLQESRGRYVGVAYPPLRARVYNMLGTASELERFFARRWPDVSLFRVNTEKLEGMTLSQYIQYFHWREDGLDPTAKKNQMPQIEGNGLALQVIEVKNPTLEFLEKYDVKPVDVFSQIYLMNFRESAGEG